MDINIVGRHTKISDDLRERITDKVSKISENAPRAMRVDVHVVHERNPRLAHESERIELTVHGRGSIIRAEAVSNDRIVALDAAATRLIERLRKEHERRAHRHQGKSGLHAVAAEPTDLPDIPGLPDLHESAAPENVEAWEGAPSSSVREIALDGTPITIRSKTHHDPAMSVAEAIDQMELVGHDFFLFHDSESGMPSAVYRRRGWTYGVIHLGAATPADDSAAERETA